MESDENNDVNGCKLEGISKRKGVHTKQVEANKKGAARLA